MSINRSLSLAFVLWAVSLSMFLSGCVDVGGADGLPDGDLEIGDFDYPIEFCDYDADCPEGQACHSGLCLDETLHPCIGLGECAWDSECSDGGYCTDQCACSAVPDGDTDGDGESADGDAEIPTDGDDDDDPDGDIDTDPDGDTDPDDDFEPDTETDEEPDAEPADCDLGPQITGQQVLDFGNAPFQTEVLRTLVLRNQCDNHPLTIRGVEIVSDSSEFRFGTLPEFPQVLNNSTVDLRIDVIYASVDPGIDEGLVKVDSDDPDGLFRVMFLTQEAGTPDIEANPNPLAMGEATVGGAAVERELTLRNVPGADSDNAVLEIGSVRIETMDSPVFELAEPTYPLYLGKGQSRGVAVTCHPPDIGEYSDRVVIESNDPVEGTFYVPVTCTGVAPLLRVFTLVEGHQLDFGTHRLSESAGVNLTLQNIGGGDLVVQEPALVLDPTDVFGLETFSWTGGDVHLGANETVAMRVTFASSEVGEFTGRIHIVSNSHDGTPFVIDLTGRASAAQIAATPAQLDFDPTRVNETSELPVTFTNEGTTSVTILDISFDEGAEVLAFAEDDVLEDIFLGPGDEHSVTVLFTPDRRGNINHFVRFTTDDPGLAEGSVNVNGQGVAPEIEVTRPDDPEFADAVDFGPVPLNGHRSLDIRVRNAGDLALTVIGADVALNSGNNEFSVSGGGAILLQPFQSRMVTVYYSPIINGGVDEGRLDIASDDPLRSTYSVQLRGEATDQHIGFEPQDGAEFEETYFGGHRTERIELTNVGYNGVLTIESLAIVAGEGTFVLLPPVQTLPFELLPNDRNAFYVDVTFYPEEPAEPYDEPVAFNGTLRVTSDSYLGASTDYALSGQGKSCPPNMWDVDDDPNDCEYPCQLSNMGVEKCDYLDNDCNGLIDDGENVAYNCSAPENAAPACIYHQCDFVCNDQYHRCGMECYPVDDPMNCGDACQICPGDAYACTRTACVDGECGNVVENGWCLIGGQCIREGEHNPENDCLVCDSANPEEWSGLANGTLCNDGLFCTLDESCRDGICTDGVERDCGGVVTDPVCQAPSCNDEEDRCEAMVANDGEPCHADDDPCTVGDACREGACAPGDPADCSFLSDACNTGVCQPLDETDYVCVKDPEGHENQECDDDNPETGPDTCQGGYCLGDGCACSGITSCCDGCQPINESGACDADGNGCTVGDSCSLGFCIPGDAPDCSAEEDDCNAGACISSGPDSFSCGKDPEPKNGWDCDDENPETGPDVCLNGNCVGDGCVCSVVDICCDGCQPRNQGGDCNADSNGCTRNDTCIDGACVPGSAPDCSHLDGACGDGVCVSIDFLSYECAVDGSAYEGDSCNDGNPDTGPDTCQGGVCLGDGCSCSGVSACCDGCQPINESGACDADGSGCTVGDTCQSGTCAVGNVPDCSGQEDECNLGVCRSDGADAYSCVKDPLPKNGHACNADWDGCTVDDYCDNGSCEAGSAVDCSTEGDACNVGECRSEGLNEFRCEKNPLPLHGEPCDADSDGCTVGDTCNLGTCEAGSVPDCSEQTDICNVGVCHSLSPETYECAQDPVPRNGAACNADSNGCTQDDACADGHCMPGEEPDCSGENDACNAGICQSTGDNTYACVDDPDGHEGDPCNADDDGCTLGDHCVEGDCVPGTEAPDCSAENDACNTGVCQSTGAESHVCVKSAEGHEGDSCNADDNGCTRDDACHEGICRPGGIPDCSAENDICNTGVCSSTGENTHECVKDPTDHENDSCDADSNPCTVGDACHGGICTPGDSVDCSEEDDACNIGVCQPNGGGGYMCIKQPQSGTSCNRDDNGCTVGDVCVNGTCTFGGPPDCSDYTDACNVGVCTSTGPDSYTCSSNPIPHNGDPCNADSNGCTQNDICNNGECIPGAMPDCSEQTDTCNEGACRSTGVDTYDCYPNPAPKNGTPCNADWNGCTAGDACQNGSCQPGPSPDCSSYDDTCVLGACRSLGPDSHECFADPSGKNYEACNADSNGCTVGDSCYNGQCYTGTPPDCSGESDQCNTGVCHSLGDQNYECQKNPIPHNGDSCNVDDSGCTQDDTCSGGICVPGSAPDCSAWSGPCKDGVCQSTGVNSYACTSDVESKNGELCNADSSGCTYDDYCSNGLCIVGYEPDCGECGDQCNTGYCNSTGDNAYECLLDSTSHNGQNCVVDGHGDGWYGYGDDGPGCLDTEDPIAEQRDYFCSGGNCTYSVLQTRECDPMDNFSGGGDNPGCGIDPDYVQEDYYANSAGACVVTMQNCLEKNCDDQDVCSPLCEGDISYSYKDFYVNASTGNCVSALGSAIDNCATKLSTDTDNGPNIFDVGGIVTDYTGCEDGACTITEYADYCEGDTVYEYGALGAGITGPTAYDCAANEYDFCLDENLLYRADYACIGEPGYCQFLGNALVQDCSIGGDACDAPELCGTTLNGCGYIERSCSSAECQANLFDVDSSREYCTSCGLQWALGGEVAPLDCCGDDTLEIVRLCTDQSDNGDCGWDTLACCYYETDCVDHNGNCVDSNTCTGFGTSGQKSYCVEGSWKDLDVTREYCEADGCGFTWVEDVSKCCGDDPGEDFEQPETEGSGCCYNGEILESGVSSGSVLCLDGLLYDCNGAAADDSELSAHIPTCGRYAGLFCSGTNTWGAFADPECGCIEDADCATGVCKYDYDGSGSWCAPATQCLHDGTAYADGQIAPDCWGSHNLATCMSGTWIEQSCGPADPCAEYYCSGGSCYSMNLSSNTLCDPNPKCSSGAGDGNFDSGGDMLCAGYCDGNGNCDWAKDCEDCSDDFSNATGTCSNNECVIGECTEGYSNCDANPSDCETLLDSDPVCLNAVSLGALDGDEYAGTLCPTECKTGPSRTGYGERWYKIYMEEESNCPADIRLRAQLQSPPGMDYDLYLYEPCGTLRDSSVNGAGEMDEVTHYISEGWLGHSDSTWMYLQIKFFSGDSCEEWTLQTKGGCPDGWD